jgi:hypothetical protein
MGYREANRYTGMGAIWVGNGVQRCQQVHMDGCYMGGYWGTEMPAGAHGWVPYGWVMGYRDANRCTWMGVIWVGNGVQRC